MALSNSGHRTVSSLPPSEQKLLSCSDRPIKIRGRRVTRTTAWEMAIKYGQNQSTVSFSRSDLFICKIYGLVRREKFFIAMYLILVRWIMERKINQRHFKNNRLLFLAFAHVFNILALNISGFTSKCQGIADKNWVVPLKFCHEVFIVFRIKLVGKWFMQKNTLKFYRFNRLLNICRW